MQSFEVVSTRHSKLVRPSLFFFPTSSTESKITLGETNNLLAGEYPADSRGETETQEMIKDWFRASSISSSILEPEKESCQRILKRIDNYGRQYIAESQLKMSGYLVRTR